MAALFQDRALMAGEYFLALATVNSRCLNPCGFSFDIQGHEDAKGAFAWFPGPRYGFQFCLLL